MDTLSGAPGDSGELCQKRARTYAPRHSRRHFGTQNQSTWEAFDALPVDADSNMRALEACVGALEMSMQSTNDTLTRCVGTSKIIISQNEIRIETQSKLAVRSSTGLDQYCDGSLSIKASAILSSRQVGPPRSRRTAR